MSCTINVTQTSRVKYTVTQDGDLRIKVNERHLVDKSLYEAIGDIIRRKLGTIDITMRGPLRPGYNYIDMYNDSCTISTRIDFSEFQDPAWVSKHWAFNSMNELQ